MRRPIQAAPALQGISPAPTGVAAGHPQRAAASATKWQSSRSSPADVQGRAHKRENRQAACPLLHFYRAREEPARSSRSFQRTTEPPSAENRRETARQSQSDAGPQANLRAPDAPGPGNNARRFD